MTPDTLRILILAADTAIPSIAAYCYPTVVSTIFNLLTDNPSDLGNAAKGSSSNQSPDPSRHAEALFYQAVTILTVRQKR
jgi:hypothetical protein